MKMFSMQRLLLAGVAGATVSLTVAGVVFAHALFQSSVPAPNATLTSEPASVSATFTEEVIPKGSSFTVTGPKGAAADNGDGHVDLNNPNRNVMVATLKPGQGSGTYTVHWTTLADDGDTANGTYTFTVNAPATAPAATTAAPAPKAAPAAGATSLVRSLPQTGGVPLVPIVGGAVALIAAGFVLRGRGR
jgi:methionine-rich copper-binding protein CopC